MIPSILLLKAKVSVNIKKIDISEILTECSLYNRTHLKNRLYKEGLKERKCEECGQDENWRGNKISLILDHINGISDDNRLENLRILCPNCNATLDTNCGKNIKFKKNLCIDCKKEILKSSKRCIECEHIKQRKYERPNYEILIGEVKSMGYTKTGKKYNVSDNTIRKWLKYYENR